jgi:endonuclease/exonuclease/phosphatase (EEP) superfamily protein YafD
MQQESLVAPRQRILPALIPLTQWYLILLLGWFVLYSLFGDGIGYLGLVNALALYLFLPLPLAILAGIFKRRREVVFMGLAGAAIFGVLWGPLFLPNTPTDANGPRLRVATFNVLGRIGDPNEVLASILDTDADVIFLQELTPEYANPLIDGLHVQYPYQILQPTERSAGMGVLSRYPLSELDVELDARWRGEPQLLRLDWEGEEIILVNFHAISTAALWPRWVARTFESREESIDMLAQFAADSAQHGPVIVAGDGNLTRLNDSYKMLDAVLEDAWWEAGTGFGHTFPGQVEPDDLLTRVSIFLIPHWLVRIDYIFHSEHWTASQAWLADFNGGSDHRGVVTDLALTGD